MYESFGFGVNANGKQRFQLFIPDAGVDPTQYHLDRGGQSRIASITVVGDFLESPWDVSRGLTMKTVPHPNGILWEAELAQPLSEGFYQYKYVVTFQNGEVRWVADPCAKLSGTDTGNTAFVVGGASLQAIDPLPSTPLSSVVAYEVMVDDATFEDRGNRAPLDVLWDRLTLVLNDVPDLNAIELMPVTAYPDDRPFDWGYGPFLLFALENSYVEDPNAPADRRVRLARLVKNCHDRGVRVLLDIVLQHVRCDAAQNGFPYHFLWQNPTESPFTGAFTKENSYEMQPLDYGNKCVLEYTRDVCCYWLETFGMDGIRFDQVSGFYLSGDVTEGAPALMAAIRAWANAESRPEPLLILEDTWDYYAISRTNEAGATACWLDPYRQVMQDATTGNLYPDVMRVLQANRDFDADKGPVICIQNHDHATLINAVGGLNYWWRTQPAAIALFTSPGAVLIHNGQERGLDAWMPEPFKEPPPRVQRRPIPWKALHQGASDQLANLYRRLAAIRKQHPALRGPHFAPANWPGSWELDSSGRGFSASRKLAIYQRGSSDDSILVALNFGDSDQTLDLPLPADGTWRDVLNVGIVFQASQGWARQVVINSHWGRILVFAGT
jgi:pullulanase